MSVQSQQNVIGVLVGTNPTGILLPVIQITDSTNATTYIADGQIIMLNHLDAPMQVANSNIGDSPWVRFVQRSGTELHFSPRIRGVDITAAKGKSYVAAQEQIWVVGYNGTSGSIDNTSTEYMFTIIYMHDDMFWSTQQNKEPFEYFNTSPTQKSIAQSFSAQINFMQARKASQGTGAAVKVEMLADGTTQGTANAATLAVTNGSDIVTFSAAQTTTILAVGNVLRIGGTTGGGAATTAGAVYIIVGNSATDSNLSSATGTTPQVRLHTPYQSTTQTATGARGTGWDFITGSANYGYKVTGLALTWVKDFFKFKKVMFHFDIRNFGATTLTKTQESSLGNGDGKLVAEFESFGAGNEGALNRTRVPLPTGRVDAVSTSTYDTIFLEWIDRSKVAVTGTGGVFKCELYIFIPDGATGATGNETILLTQLNPYIASSPSALPAVTI